MYKYQQALAVLSLSLTAVSGLSTHFIEGETPQISASPQVNTGPLDLTQNTRGTKTNKPLSYPRSHAYGTTYGFSPRDGWEAAAITDLPYKYSNATSLRSNPPLRRQRSSVKRVVGGVLGGTVSHAVGAAWNNLRGSGKSQDVTITWYTGQDLANPSCWPESEWTPTDASFACALTLEGWVSKPDCFKFLELCNGPGKCIFVRVVDTCAGCKKGSKHVDLTKAAFAELADLELGILTVQMRMASDPRIWHTELWGPKV